MGRSRPCRRARRTHTVICSHAGRKHAAGACAPSIAKVPTGHALHTAFSAVEARKVLPVQGAQVVEDGLVSPAPGTHWHAEADVEPRGENWYAPQAVHVVETPDPVAYVLVGQAGDAEKETDPPQLATTVVTPRRFDAKPVFER